MAKQRSGGYLMSQSFKELDIVESEGRWHGNIVRVFQAELSDGKLYECSFVPTGKRDGKKYLEYALDAFERKQKEIDENSGNPTI